jgi:acetyltransferase
MKGFFYPSSVVVIGVSEKPANMGRMIVKNMIAKGFSGQVHAVGPTGGVILGRPIRNSVKDITFPMDLAVILTPAHTIPELVRECGQQGIRRIVIESAGFSELSRDRSSLEEELLTIAAEYGIRFIGPNCIGLVNTENGLSTPFVAVSTQFETGKVSVISQSGGVALNYMDALAFEGVHFNKVTSIGNKLNVNETELLDYFVNEDNGTEIICMYLEGFKDGRKLLETARASTKPIIVHKSGIGKAGAASAASHTGSLASDDKIVSSAFKQAGMIRVRSTGMMMDLVKIFELPPMKGRNLAIVSRSGGHGVIAADTAEHFEFNLPSFPQDDIQMIKRHVRGGVINLRNPLDLGDLFDLSIYEEIAQQILSNQNIHGLVLVHGYSEAEKEASRQFMGLVKELSETHQKPVALCLNIDDDETAYLKRHFDFPFYSSPEDGTLALNVSYRTHLYREAHKSFRPYVKKVDNASASKILEGAKAESRNPSQVECFDILKCYDFPVPEYRRAQSANEAAKAAGEIGYPVVLKVDVPSIIHKSDVGGIMLNLDTPEAVIAAFDRLQTRLQGQLKESEPFATIVMEQADADGQEVILGIKQDATFGPVLLFGLGGIFAELMEDISLRVLPVDRTDVVEMVQEIRGYETLTGARGIAAKDIDSLVDQLLNLSQLAQDFQQIKEVDLNPAICYENGCLVLDARFIL